MEMAISDDVSWLVNTCEWGRCMKQVVRYMDYVIKKKSNHEYYKNFWQFVQVKICIMGIKIKVTGET